MSTAKKSANSKNSKAASETSESINQQIQAFLKAGGMIEEVKQGVSGQQQVTSKKHITISTKK